MDFCGYAPRAKIHKYRKESVKVVKNGTCKIIVCGG